jgi:hypothetical protein
MTHFLAIEETKYYAIPFTVCDDAFQLGCLVPQELEWIWMEESSLFSLFQASTSIFEWLVAHSFSNYLFLHGNGFFFSSSCLDKGGLS